jgi:hypothetical protein
MNQPGTKNCSFSVFVPWPAGIVEFVVSVGKPPYLFVKEWNRFKFSKLNLTQIAIYVCINLPFFYFE